MNPLERFGLALAELFPYLVIAALVGALLWLVYLAVMVGRLRGSTLEFGALFRHPQWPLTLRYPQWWEVRMVGDAVEFDSHEKDGVLRLACRDAVACSDDPRDLVREALNTMEVALDEPDVRPIRVNPYAGGHGSGFADRLNTAPPEPGAPPGYKNEKRCFAAAWAFRGPRTIAIFTYQCSVLFGMVDGYYHDLMMPTLLLDDEVPPQVDLVGDRNVLDAPALSGV